MNAAPAPAALGTAIRADLLDFAAEPGWGELAPAALRWRPEHWLLVDPAGRIAGVSAAPPPPGWARDEQHRGRLLLPGFVDTHVHSPQIEVLASYGTELLDWLQRYTFPAERAWADPAVAAAGSQRFVQALLAHGTTAAVVFPTVHKGSAEALFEAAAAVDMRVVAGKVLMDRHAPDGLRDDVEQAGRDIADLIARWHGRGRAAYALTVRFAPTSTPAQLAMAGELARADPSLYLQTHVAENRAEGRWVAQLFPDARSYLDVYDRVGLLHPKSVLAHGIWLDADDHARLRDAGAQIAHCPTSNLFLGSGLFDWFGTRAAGVGVSLASDVGGGTSLSLLRNAAAAYQVQQLRRAAGDEARRMPAPPTAWTLLHAATRGAAQGLGLAHEIGAFEPGLVADCCAWDWAVGALDGRRQQVAQDLHEKLFAWLTLADERHLAQTWVAGRPVYKRAG